MAWEARWGLKLYYVEIYRSRLNRLNGLGSPLGIETELIAFENSRAPYRLNGLGSPLGIETLEV